MKSIRFYFIVVALAILLNYTADSEEKPEKVHSIVVKPMDYAWYVGQARLWKKELGKNKKSEDAWLNYYIANRMAKLTGEPDKWNFSKDDVLKGLDEIISEMEKNIPNSFTYNYVKYYNSGFNLEAFPYLEKAYSINPDRTETYDDFAGYCEVKRDTAKKAEFCRKMYESNMISPGILAWNYNLLMSLDSGAIVFTNGDNDTYPGWLLQEALGVRKDVRILNMSLLMIDEYCDAVQRELNIKPFGKRVEDYFPKKDEKDSSNNDVASIIMKYRLDLYEYIIKNGKLPVYFAASAVETVYGQFSENLYIEGLAFKYSEEKYDNIAALKRNVEKRFMLDYIKADFTNDISKDIVAGMNTNYIMPFYNLYNHYIISEENQKAEKMKELIKIIAAKSGSGGDILQELEK